MFTAALFSIITKTWKQLKCSHTHKWKTKILKCKINVLYNIYITQP